MVVPLEVLFRDMVPSAALEAKIRERAQELEQFYGEIISCRVVVEQHHRHHRQGNLFHVRIGLKVPGGELVASRDPGQHRAHEDAYVTIRDAFDAMRRRLEDHTRRRHGRAKTHAPPHRRSVET